MLYKGYNRNEYFTLTSTLSISLRAVSSQRPERTVWWQQHSNLCSKVNVLTKPLRFNAKHEQQSSACSLSSYRRCRTSIRHILHRFLFASVYEKKKYRWGSICKDTAFISIYQSIAGVYTHHDKSSRSNMKLRDVDEQGAACRLMLDEQFWAGGHFIYSWHSSI